MYVKNHGFSPESLGRLTGAAEQFFSLPVDAKMGVAVEDSPQFRGYLPLEYSGDEGEAGKNLQEAFMIMHDRPRGPIPMHGPNQWPGALPALRPAMLDYFAGMERLASPMLQGFAMALGLRRDYFDDVHRDPMNTLKLNHYPPQKIVEDTDLIGVGGHCDGGSFTILWQDSQGGLEVLSKDGDWVGVPPVEGTFVINIANMMQRWSNGRFSSTEHRVINRFGKDRYSIAFFVYPAYTTVVGPVVDLDRSTVPPIVVGEDMLTNFRRIYPQRLGASG